MSSNLCLGKKKGETAAFSLCSSFYSWASEVLLVFRSNIEICRSWYGPRSLSLLDLFSAAAKVMCIFTACSSRCLHPKSISLYHFRAEEAGASVLETHGKQLSLEARAGEVSGKGGTTSASIRFTSTSLHQLQLLPVLSGELQKQVGQSTKELWKPIAGMVKRELERQREEQKRCPSS